jgi:putative oxidoreductase
MDESPSRRRDLGLLCLRIGPGLLFILAGWAKVSYVAGVVGLWHRLQLPFPPVFGPIHATVEFGGGILLLAGLFTRWVSLLLAVDMIGALFLVKIHTSTFIGLEWVLVWVSLALLALGAGRISVDAFLQNRRAQASRSTVYQR